MNCESGLRLNDGIKRTGRGNMYVRECVRVCVRER